MSRQTKKLAALALVGALALSACSGGSSGDTSSGGGDDQPYVAIVSKGFSQQYWQIVKSGAEDKAAELGVRMTFVGPPDESAVEDQIQQLTDALGSNPDAIGFAALDSRAAAPLMDQAQERDIPVVAFDSGVDSDIPVATVATDNKAAAAEAAEHMSDLLGGKGKVAVIGIDQTSKSGVDRRDGFVEWMTENAPDIEVLEPQYAESDQTKAADIAKSFIQANPDLDGIFGVNEAAATGMVKGAQETGKEGLTLVGFDSGTAQVNFVKDGTMAGAVTQNPYGMGEQVVQTAVDAINGTTVENFIDTGFYWYDQSNISDPEIDKSLYY